MNENLNLVEILKDCPRGTKLYATVFGEVELDKVDSCGEYPISIRLNNVGREILTSEGKLCREYDGECILFPSKDQRDWSKFKTKLQQKFDPAILKPFDKVLFRDFKTEEWTCGFFSHMSWSGFLTMINNCQYKCCVPYNDETKNLVGTKNEEPEYYRYWED